jgi:formylglycine-generating enzyme required for sulfatase activity
VGLTLVGIAVAGLTSCGEEQRTALPDSSASVSTEEAPEAPAEPLVYSVLETAPAGAPPSRIRRVEDGAEMVRIPPGDFLMGAVPGDREANLVELPRVRITISSAYYMDTHEVTVGMWNRFVAARGVGVRATGEENAPVTEIRWEDARAYARWVGGDLPTEAQWERAARGGVEGWVFPWGTRDDPERRGGPPQRGYRLAEVGSFPPNSYGLYDMCGNASEYCRDYYEIDYLEMAEKQPVDFLIARPGLGEFVAVRGGSVACEQRDLRVSSRSFLPLGSRGGIAVGFRCVVAGDRVYAPSAE